MNRKYLLRGIGIGLIIGCLVTYTAFRTGNYIKSNGTVATADASAKTTEATTAKATTTEATTTEATTTEATTTEATTTEATTTEEKTTEVATEEKTTEVATEEKTTEAAESKEVSITVSAGMGSESVCSLLYEAGLIDDEYAYNLYLENNGYASSIRVGTFTFTKGMSEADIANVLTTQGR